MATKAKHTPWTPGTWEITKQGRDLIISAFAGRNKTLPICLGIVPWNPVVHWSEQKANANIMAAAPVMLNALHVALEMLQECLRTTGCSDQADAIDGVCGVVEGAIRKATE